MVFDHAGRYLYITTSDGFVRPYNLSTGQLEAGYNLGGSLNGVDIGSDDSFLLVAQKNLVNSQVVVHRINLATGSVTNIGFTPLYFESVTGACDVAVASNGLALVTSYRSAGGRAFIRQINLGTNAISQRNDAPGNGVANSGDAEIDDNTNIHRSADGSRFYFIGLTDSSGPVFTYDATANTFSDTVQTDIFTNTSGAALSRNGSLIATQLIGNGLTLDTGSNFSFVHNFNQPDGGVAFDAQSDTLYAVLSSAGRVVAYDTNTFVEKFRFDVGETISAGVAQFGTGTLVASADGRHLALETPLGIRVYDLSAVTPIPAPAPTFNSPRDMVFDHAGQYLYITTADGFVWTYNVPSGTLGTPYNLGGSLNALDIAPDDSFLLVAQGYSGIAQGAFQKLNLGTGSVVNINYTHDKFNAWTWSGEWGAWRVAIASNGLALVTTNAVVLGNACLLRQINLSNNTIATRTDLAGRPGGLVSERTDVYRGADRSRLYILETQVSPDHTIVTYSAATNTFVRGAGTWTDNYLSSAAVNRDGTLLGTQRRSTSFVELDAAPSANFVHNFNYLDSGVAFDSVQDTVYGVNSSRDQIVAYDTNTFAEKFRFDIGENVPAGATEFGNGLLVASQDGRYLALRTPTTIRIYGVPAVQLVSVASVKTHAGAGALNLPLPLDGPAGIESRSGGTGGNHTMVFTFGLNIVSVGGASVTAGTGTVSSFAIDPTDSQRCIVSLTGVTNAQYVTVTLTNVVDSAGNLTWSISQKMGVLLGDVNGDGLVNAGDTIVVRSNSGSDVTTSTLRMDVNADGLINAGDTIVVRNQSGTALPTQQAAKSSPIRKGKGGLKPSGR